MFLRGTYKGIAKKKEPVTSYFEVAGFLPYHDVDQEN
jgi:hypothetical protein